jgi:hypothetical protein
MAKYIPHNGVLDLGLPRSRCGPVAQGRTGNMMLAGLAWREGRLSDSRDVIP